MNHGYCRLDPAYIHSPIRTFCSPHLRRSPHRRSSQTNPSSSSCRTGFTSTRWYSHRLSLRTKTYALQTWSDSKPIRIVQKHLLYFRGSECVSPTYFISHMPFSPSVIAHPFISGICQPKLGHMNEHDQTKRPQTDWWHGAEYMLLW